MSSQPFLIYILLPPNHEPYEVEVESADLTVKTLVEQIVDQLQLTLCEEGIQIQYSLVRVTNRFEKIDERLTCQQAGIKAFEEYSISRDFLLTPTREEAPKTEEFKLVDIFNPRTSALPDLTPGDLFDHLAPYLKALQDTQQILDEANRRPLSPLKIKQIRQGFPLGLTLEGLSEGVYEILEMLTLWKKSRIQTLEELDLKALEIELEQKRLDMEQRQREASGEGPGSRLKEYLDSQSLLERQKRLDQAQKKLQSQRFEIDAKDADFVTAILRRKAPCLTMDQRAEYAALLRPAVEVILSEEIELVRSR